jgi:hypothetical protein
VSLREDASAPINGPSTAQAKRCFGFELMNARQPRQKSFPNSEIRHSWDHGTAEARFGRARPKLATERG